MTEQGRGLPGRVVSTLQQLLHGSQQQRETSLKIEQKALRAGVGCRGLVRPSYVLSGAAMNVGVAAEELTGYLGQAAEVSKDKPVVVSKFIEDGREIDVLVTASHLIR